MKFSDPFLCIIFPYYISTSILTMSDMISKFHTITMFIVANINGMFHAEFVGIFMIFLPNFTFLV
jgi:hypothetical protein